MFAVGVKRRRRNKLEKSERFDDETNYDPKCADAFVDAYGLLMDYIYFLSIDENDANREENDNDSKDG